MSDFEYPSPYDFAKYEKVPSFYEYKIEGLQFNFGWRFTLNHYTSGLDRNFVKHCQHCHITIPKHVRKTVVRIMCSAWQYIF